MNVNATVIVEILIFAAFVGITRRYVWPPIFSAIAERQKEQTEGLEKARQSTVLLEEAQTEYDKVIKSAGEKYRSIVDEAESAYRQRLNAARTDAEDLKNLQIREAKKLITIEKQKVRSELEKEMSAYIHIALSKILRQTPDKENLDRMIETTLEEVAREQSD